MKKGRNIKINVFGDAKTGKFHALPEMRAGSKQSTLPTPAKPMTTAEIPPEEDGGYEWAPWKNPFGYGDNLPTFIRCAFEKVGLAGRVQHDLAKMLFGNGLVYYRRKDLYAGIVKPVKIPKIEDWLEENMIETEWLFPQFLDYRYNWNSFSEMILSKDAKLITSIYHKEAEFCRLGKQNKNNFKIEEIWYSPYFKQGAPPSQQKRKKIPLMPWFDRRKFVDKLGTKRQFAWHTRVKTPGTVYYARPYWIGLIRENGWIDVAAKVPEIINSMQSSQIILKYQINIPESYFKVRYQGWDAFSDDERNNLIDTLVTAIETQLTDTKNAFKSITTVFRQNEITQKDEGKVEIIALDDKVKANNWVPSSNAADAQIVQALGGQPSMIGLAPEGGSMGAGSGSDKRELFNIEVDTNTVEQLKILEPLNYIALYNRTEDPDWDVVFRIDHNRHTTKDKNEHGREESETQPDATVLSSTS
jgi:hypothetical protein